MGAHDFKLNMVPLFARKPGNVNVSRSAAPKLALVPASRFTAISINKSQCLFQVSLGLKEVQMEVNDLNLTRCLIFARKPVNINVLRSATPKPARVPANRYYFDVYYSYFNVCFKLC